MSVNTAPSTAQDSTALEGIWKTISAESCPYHYNFHMHTICSDGQLEPEALIAQAIKIGLKGLAITDHHSIQGYEIAQRCLAQQVQDNLPQLWTGIEVTSNLFGTQVHILGYAFDPYHQSMEHYVQGYQPRDNNAAKVVAAIHKAGGLAVLAHPARYRRSVLELIPLGVKIGIDGVETYYAYGNPNPWKPSWRQMQQVRELSQAYQLYSTCGTDTHGLNLLRRL
jgi:hypothetical protein